MGLTCTGERGERRGVRREKEIEGWVGPVRESEKEGRLEIQRGKRDDTLEKLLQTLQREKVRRKYCQLVIPK